MEALQKAITAAIAQLRDLSVSQRAAIFLGGAFAAVALAWMVQWAARPEMVPLMPQSLTTEEVARIAGGLSLMNEPHEAGTSQVMVRAEANKPAILAQLQQLDRLPADTSVSFDALVKESNPWVSQEENDRRWTVALQREIELVLRQLSGVKAARVFLNLHQRRSFSRETPASTASVTLIMQGGEPVSRSLARAAARLVSGAVRGLPIRNVQVVDGNGVSALEWENEDAAGGAGLAMQRREQERLLAEKIRSQLAFDPRVRVSVQVDLDLTSRSSETVTPTDPVDVFEDRRTESSARSRPSGQPGVQPNVGLSAGGGARDENSTVESTKTERIAGNRRTSESKPSGEIQSVSAAVNISHSYLAGVFRRQNPTATEPPTAEQIAQVFDKERPRVLSQVAVLVKPATEEQVRVDWYYDQVDEVAEAAAAADSASMLDTASRYAPQAALGLLALISLGVMFRLSRRSAAGEAFGIELGLPKEAIDAARQAAQDVGAAAAAARQQREEEEAIEPGERLPQYQTAQPVGRAAGTDGVLEAREVDERTIQIGKMVDQLGQMIKNDKDSVAAALEQWVRRRD
ncbi:MAG: hypothetical protein HRU75_06310 [Planctomycetia bacterium]|nr:MAG: hypothetical protein HRU75_06310 [Planctomycetia bacterium]